MKLNYTEYYFAVGVDAACPGAGVDTVLVHTALVAAALAVVYGEKNWLDIKQ